MPAIYNIVPYASGCLPHFIIVWFHLIIIRLLRSMKASMFFITVSPVFSMMSSYVMKVLN